MIWRCVIPKATEASFQYLESVISPKFDRDEQKKRKTVKEERSVAKLIKEALDDYHNTEPDQALLKLILDRYSDHILECGDPGTQFRALWNPDERDKLTEREEELIVKWFDIQGYSIEFGRFAHTVATIKKKM
jgi:hypothetical protein